MARAMAKNGMCGWYYRVLKPGTLETGDSASLLERPHPTWTVERVNRPIIQRHGTAAEREEFLRLTSALSVPH